MPRLSWSPRIWRVVRLALVVGLGGLTPPSPSFAAPADTAFGTLVADTLIFSTSPDGNGPSSDTLYAGSLYQGDFYTTWRSFLRFDLPSLPSGAVIDQALLRLYQHSATGSGEMPAELCEAAAAWQETGVTWRNQPSVRNPCAVLALDATSGWREWDVTDSVEAWQQGERANDGFRLRRQGDDVQERNQVRGMASREWSNVPLRPQLEIRYHVVTLSGWIRSERGCVETGDAPVYRPGDTLRAPFRVDGATSIEVRILYLGAPGGPTVIDGGTVEGGRTYEIDPRTIGAGAVGRRGLGLEARVGTQDFQELNRCGFDLAAEPTPTPTDRPTLPPSPTDPATATPTTTPRPGSRVAGHLVLERRASSAGARIELAGQIAWSDTSGDFQLVNVPEGEWDVQVSHPSYLSHRQSVRIEAGTSLDLPAFRMLAGDLDRDERVGADDQALLMGAWRTRPGDAAWDPALDITDDGEVGLPDLVALRFNWGRTVERASTRASTWASNGGVAPRHPLRGVAEPQPVRSRRVSRR